MTTELEQEFFKAFRIARQHLLNVNTNQFVDVYPEITDRVLLELVCIANKYFGDIYFGKNVEQLKETVLINLAKVSDVIWVKQQIRQLFKGENERRNIN